MKVYSKVAELQGFSSSEVQVDFDETGVVDVEEWVAELICNSAPFIYSKNEDDLHPSYKARDLPEDSSRIEEMKHDT